MRKALGKISNNRLALFSLLSLASLLLMPFFGKLNVWIFVGILFSFLTVTDIFVMLKTRIPFGHLMILNYFLQFFLISLFLYFYPNTQAQYSIPRYDYPDYLSFIIPACIAVYFGYHFGSRASKESRHNNHASSGWTKYTELLCWTGLIFWIIPKGSLPSSLSFFFVLLGNLRYVGFFSLILAKNKRWVFYGVVIFILEFIVALQSAMFHELIIWVAAFIFIVFYRYNLRKFIVPMLVVCLSFLFILQGAKPVYRQIIDQNSSPLESLTLLKDSMFQQIGDLSFQGDITKFSDSLPRFNQGWIVNDVMNYVPLFEPYAYGQTISRGLYMSIVPRFFDKNKQTAGGQALFEQYTGQLLTNTVMNISLLGEMYVNFGRIGAIICMFIFGLLIGFLYKNIFLLSFQSPLWWAWIPYVGFYAFKAEEGFAEILSWIIKSLVVMAVIIFLANFFTKRENEVFPSVK